MPSIQEIKTEIEDLRENILFYKTALEGIDYQAKNSEDNCWRQRANLAESFYQLGEKYEALAQQASLTTLEQEQHWNAAVMAYFESYQLTVHYKSSCKLNLDVCFLDLIESKQENQNFVESINTGAQRLKQTLKLFVSSSAANREFMTALRFFSGIGKQQSYHHAFACFKNIENKFPDSGFFLARMLFFGFGVKKDYTGALTYLSKAAIKKSLLAQCALLSLGYGYSLRLDNIGDPFFSIEETEFTFDERRKKNLLFVKDTKEKIQMFSKVAIFPSLPIDVGNEQHVLVYEFVKAPSLAAHPGFLMLGRKKLFSAHVDEEALKKSSSQHYLMALYSIDTDPEGWLAKVAEQNHPVALVLLGVLYASENAEMAGKCTEHFLPRLYTYTHQDKALAAEYIRKSLFMFRILCKFNLIPNKKINEVYEVLDKFKLYDSAPSSLKDMAGYCEDILLNRNLAAKNVLKNLNTEKSDINYIYYQAISEGCFQENCFCQSEFLKFFMAPLFGSAEEQLENLANQLVEAKVIPLNHKLMLVECMIEAISNSKSLGFNNFFESKPKEVPRLKELITFKFAYLKHSQAIVLLHMKDQPKFKEEAFKLIKEAIALLSSIPKESRYWQDAMSENYDLHQCLYPDIDAQALRRKLFGEIDENKALGAMSANDTKHLHTSFTERNFSVFNHPSVEKNDQSVKESFGKEEITNNKPTLNKPNG